MSARRATDLKSHPRPGFSPLPKRLREGHKNFDVYPRDKRKPILSRRGGIKPRHFPSISACARARDSALTAERNELPPRPTDVTEDSRQLSGRVEEVRGGDSKGSRTVSLCRFIAGDTREVGKRRVVPRRNETPGRKVLGGIYIMPKSQNGKHRDGNAEGMEEDMRIRATPLAVIPLRFTTRQGASFIFPTQYNGAPLNLHDRTTNVPSRTRS